MDELLTFSEADGVVEGRPNVQLLRRAADVADLVGTCYGYQAQRVLLYDANLSPGFFDLSSGEAGEILQKLRNYSIKLAVVLSPDGRAQSRMFREMVSEESHGGDFRLFDDRAAALAWLQGG